MDPQEQLVQKNKRIVILLVLPLAIGFILVACLIEHLNIMLSLNLPASSVKTLRFGLFLTGCFDFLLLFFMLKILKKNAKK